MISETLMRWCYCQKSDKKTIFLTASSTFSVTPLKTTPFTLSYPALTTCAKFKAKFLIAKSSQPLLPARSLVFPYAFRGALWVHFLTHSSQSALVRKPLHLASPISYVSCFTKKPHASLYFKKTSHHGVLKHKLRYSQPCTWPFPSVQDSFFHCRRGLECISGMLIT